jgi:hypothetical protein
MKRIFNFLLTVLAVMALTLTVSAQRWVSGTSTDIGATNTYFIARADLAGQPVVSYFSATSDKAASTIKGYSTAAGIPVTATAASGQAVVTHASGASAFAANDIVIVRSVANNTYQRVVVASDTSTSVTFNENLNFTLAAGDQLYIATVNAQIPVAAATVSVISETFAGTEGRPLLIDLDGTSASQINAITVEYKSTR